MHDLTKSELLETPAEPSEILTNNTPFIYKKRSIQEHLKTNPKQPKHQPQQNTTCVVVRHHPKKNQKPLNTTHKKAGSLLINNDPTFRNSNYWIGVSFSP
jgi:hypothetical protein